MKLCANHSRPHPFYCLVVEVGTCRLGDAHVIEVHVAILFIYMFAFFFFFFFHFLFISVLQDPGDIVLNPDSLAQFSQIDLDAVVGGVLLHLYSIHIHVYMYILHLLFVMSLE